MELRPYQHEAVTKTWEILVKDKDAKPVIVVPTGGGKSLILAALAAKTKKKVIILQHRKELIQQNYEKLIKLGVTDIGVFSASLGKKEINKRVIVAGIQSIYKHWGKFRDEYLVIVDESHLISDKDESTYLTFLSNIKHRIVGLTATPFRTKTGSIIGQMFSEISYEVQMSTLIKAGHLVPLTSKTSFDLTPDTSNVKVSAGEYVMREIEMLYDERALNREILKDIKKRARGRESILVFCSGVAHAEKFLKVIDEPAVMVVGDSLFRDRDIKLFKERKVRWLVSVDALTTGFDAPCIDCLVLLRPTRSPGLYVQMVGRGMRPYQNKFNCIAEGQLVLTNYGLVPIEKIKLYMKVWDGCDFVSHCGIILRGEQEVIEYEGLTATRDHKVWTEKGWETFGECANQQIPIANTGNGRLPIFLSNGSFGGNLSQGQSQSNIFKNSMLNLWQNRIKVVLQFIKKGCWLPKMWQGLPCQDSLSWGSPVATSSLYSGEISMFQSKKQSLFSVWGKGDSIQFWKSKLDGEIYNGQPGLRQDKANRPNRQRWSLRKREPKVIYSISKLISYAKKAIKSICAFFSTRVSSCKIRGFDIKKFDRERTFFRADRKKIPTPLKETKRKVWDILNAGPLRRFTVQGKLVSNCLILDYAGNLERFGAVDQIGVRRVIKNVGEEEVDELITGKLYTKFCPSCGELCSIFLKNCPSCSFTFAMETIGIRASESSVMSGDEEEVIFDVLETTFKTHKKAGKPNSFRLDYNIGTTDVISEYLLFEHNAWGRKKAQARWRKQCFEVFGNDEPPETVADAFGRAIMGELKGVSKIKVKKEKGFWRVLAWKWDESKVLDSPDLYVAMSVEEELLDAFS